MARRHSEGGEQGKKSGGSHVLLFIVRTYGSPSGATLPDARTRRESPPFDPPATAVETSSCRADGRRLVDPIGPAERVNLRGSSRVRSRGEQRLEQHVADGRIVEPAGGEGRPRDAPDRRQLHRLAFLGGRLVPPDGHRFGVVRAGRRDREPGYSAGSRNGWPSRASAAPIEARGNPGRRGGERAAHEIGHGPEILGDDRRAGLAEDRQHPFAERDLGLLVGRREKRLAAVLRPGERPVEADQVIDAVPVEQIGAAPRRARAATGNARRR